MKNGEKLAVLSQGLNVLIFLYFVVVLLKLNVLDVTGLAISAFGIFMSLVSNIVSALEK